MNRAATYQPDAGGARRRRWPVTALVIISSPRRNPGLTGIVARDFLTNSQGRCMSPILRSSGIDVEVYSSNILST